MGGSFTRSSRDPRLDGVDPVSLLAILREQERQRGEAAAIEEQAKWIDLKKIEAGVEIIHLNVGGKMFWIPKEELLQHKDGLLYRLISSNNWKPDSHGDYLINRDPYMFYRVVDYLRHGHWQHDVILDDKDLEALRAHAAFFELPPPPSLSSEDTPTDGNRCSRKRKQGPLSPLKIPRLAKIQAKESLESETSSND